MPQEFQNQTSDQFIPEQKPKHTRLIILTVFLILAGISAVGYFLYQNNELTIPSENQNIIVDETANWKTYRNEEYGFEFTYPARFGALVPNIYPNNYRESGMYVEGPDSTGVRYIKYKDRVFPIESLVTSPLGDLDQETLPDTLYVDIFDLAKYRFIDRPSGHEYGYDIGSGSWWVVSSIEGRKPFTPEKINGGYKFRTGDAGLSNDVFAISVEKQNVMIEIGLATYETAHVVQERVTMDQILSTFKFTK